MNKSTIILIGIGVAVAFGLLMFGLDNLYSVVLVMGS